DWRNPLLQPVAVAAWAALPLGHRDAGGDQRIGGGRFARQYAIGITLPQPEGREDQPVRFAEGNQPPQDRRRQRHHFEAAAADAGDALQGAPRLGADDIEEGFRRATGDRVLVDDMQRIMRLLDVQPRDRAPGAAYQVQRSTGAFAQQRGGRDDPL